ncbi:hypothetical protein HU200_015215 [Digitaria exilis]|uniref:Uncharacterized protein n=1 Tax=Digitaria exilis TaxID=1010633 RepID=A0A835KI89_9POAL|nr:hypothetical protein HU200_015215 [Digitaria exilis]
MDHQHSSLTKLGFVVLSFNSALAIHNSWGDAGSVAFVLAADAALVLLFRCLRELEFERGEGGGRNKAFVWALTTLLTAMFAAKVAALMPPVIAAVVWAVAVATTGEADVPSEQSAAARAKPKYRPLVSPQRMKKKRDAAPRVCADGEGSERVKQRN